MKYIPRFLQPNILNALQKHPAVFINGPRQVGKTTLAKQVIQEAWPADYVTFDDMNVLAAAHADPEHFITRFSRPVVIDEVQMAPMIFRAVKKYIDELRAMPGKNPNGQLLLTGSANVLALPELADALVGRMRTLTLYPLSMGEVVNNANHFIDRLIKNKFSFEKQPFSDESVLTYIQRATFPEISGQLDTQPGWLTAYLTTLLQRDVRALADIEKLTALPQIVNLLAARVSSLVNDASVARDLQFNAVTYRRYRALLINVFLCYFVQPWFGNIGKRFVKSPKLYFTDTLLLLHVLGFTNKQLADIPDNLRGRVIENFVAAELTKQISLLSNMALYHYRTNDDKEIDFIIEFDGGKLIAIEVKSRNSINASDFKQIKGLQNKVSKSFVAGVVLYLGKDIIPFGEKLTALPIQSLWEL